MKCGQRTAVVAWIATALVAGCGSSPQATQAPYVITLHASASVNPNASGKPAPILVGVYELKSATRFEAGDFAALQDRSKEVLADDLISVEQVLLLPGDHKVIQRPGNTLAHEIGVVAGYRVLDGRVWKTSVPLAVPKPAFYKIWKIFSAQSIRLDVTLDDDGVRVDQDKDGRRQGK